MSIANDPVARIYLDIADEAFKRGLREANKEFKNSATEWNSRLDLFNKGWTILDRTFSKVWKVGKDMLKDLSKETTEAGKAAKQLLDTFQEVQNSIARAWIETGEFGHTVRLLNQHLQETKEALGTDRWKTVREDLMAAGLAMTSYLIRPLSAIVTLSGKAYFSIRAIRDAFTDDRLGFFQALGANSVIAKKRINELESAVNGFHQALEGTAPLVESLESGAFDPNNPLIINKFSMTDPSFLPGKGSAKSSRSRSKGLTDTGMKIGIKTRDLDFSRDTDIGIARFTPGDIAPEQEESEQEKRMARMRERYQADIQQMRDWKGQLSEAGLALGQSIGQGFAAGIAAMVSGTGSFMDEMRKMIGQFLVQIGTMLMSTAGGVLAGAALAAVFPPARPFLDPTGQAVPVALATLAAGGVLVATGTAMSGAAGRSGTRSPQRVTPVRGSGASSAGFSGFGDLGGGGGNTTLIVNFNGPVTNPRRTAREFGSVLQSSGVTVGGT